MALVSLSNIGQSFGAFDVFGGITASIPNDGRVGLVGPNGIGKTTLLLILAGEASPTTGTLHIAKGTRVGYLPQEAMQAFIGRSHTVYAEMLTVFAELRHDEKKLRELEARMAAGDHSAELLDQYASLQHRFEAAGGYDYPLRIRQVLTGLGFDEESQQLSLDVLSGGQKTRALLGRLLLEKPDLLILDEPSNHLDIAAVEWLEGALKTWDGAIIVVSHDRYFLDKVVNNIWEMSRSGVETYRGTYSHYVTQREERWSLRQKQYDDMQATFLKELDFIKRNIARDSTKDMAVGKLKRLIRQVKMVQIAGPDSLQMDWAKASAQWGISKAKWEVPDVEQAIKALPRPTNRPPQLNLNLHAGHRSGNIVMRTTDLEIGYPGVSLFRADDIELHRLEVAALIGPNGTGKSTFLKTILKRIDPLAGVITLGASLKVGYFAQAHDELNRDNTVLDELLSHSNMFVGEARNYLGRYLFRGDDVYKPISLLSGGERGRLALAILALSDANFLLLDEPTNHLDIPAQEILQEVLEQFNGTILMVSHDRYLVAHLATQIWELRDDQLRVYYGDYEAYLTARMQEREADRAEREAEKLAANGSQPIEPERKGLSKNEMRRRRRALDLVEGQIEAVEEEMMRCTDELQAASEAQDFGRIQAASDAYETAQRELEELLAEWEKLAVEG
ncbi:MAG: ATP-binding cassette domain-containing protein [Anaerolineae bacterium]|nr:ATP-binding cassette domain-containing protein [Anaerolineae bacterium]